MNRIGPAGEAELTEAYRKWHDKTLRARVMQQRCAAQYEKKVGLVNDWLTRQGNYITREGVSVRASVFVVVSLQLRFFSGEFQRPGWPQLESVEGTVAAMKNYMYHEPPRRRHPSEAQ